MNDALNKYSFSRKPNYRHFESIEGLFYNLSEKYTLSSINNFTPRISELAEDFRITRFIRDPRDLVISGYFYHKKGAEPWFRFKNPSLKYWSDINANLPIEMPSNVSYSEYLDSISLEEGLKAEIDFRKFHFESMRNWKDDKRIKLFRYEDIMDDQVGAFKGIADHLEFDGLQKRKIIYFAGKYALEKRGKDKHIRDSNFGQWKKYFSDELNEYFLGLNADILEKYNYSKY